MTLPPQPTPEVGPTWPPVSFLEFKELVHHLVGEQINGLHQKIQELEKRIDDLRVKH